jgi:hypothetical protein
VSTLKKSTAITLFAWHRSNYRTPQGGLRLTLDFLTTTPLPMTYMLDGRQYVLIAAGNTLVAFGLPQE